MTQLVGNLSMIDNQHIINRNGSSDKDGEIDQQDIVLNCRWVLEGILLPCIGIIGILGKSSKKRE